MKVALKVTRITLGLLVGLVIILLFSTNHLPKGDLLTKAISPINGVELNVPKDVYDWRKQSPAQLRFDIHKYFNTKGELH